MAAAGTMAQPLLPAAPSLVTSAASALPPVVPPPLPPPLQLTMPPLGSGLCGAAGQPQAVAHARAQFEALRLTQNPNQWVLLPQRLLEQHIPQLLAAAMTVGGPPEPPEPPRPSPPVLVLQPLPPPTLRAPGTAPGCWSLLQGEFDGSGI